jgi:glycosyltransferase involved in cell wall biosynthesis
MKVSLVVPVFEEEAIIEETISQLTRVIETATDSYEIIFCLDPGKDKTFQKLMKANLDNPAIKTLLFSRRFGQPAATLAGLNYAAGEYVCVFDADLQDPPELILQMLDECHKGNDVVLATRISRDGESHARKLIAKIAYKLINRASDLEIPKDTGDCRMFSRRALNSLLNTQDQDAFLRGMTSYIGFNQTRIYFNRKARESGESKYNAYTGSLRIGLNGLIGYSTKPLTYLALMGVATSLFSLILATYFLIAKFLFNQFTPGLSTMGILITFFSGLQIFGIGLVGEYVGRIYSEVRKRPIFIVQEQIGDFSNNSGSKNE